jgi:hypothetical protein
VGRRRGEWVSRRLLGGAVAVYRALIAFGAIWVTLPEDQLKLILRNDHGGSGNVAGKATGSGRRDSAARRPPRQLAACPPPGHPERLRQDIPLSPLERRLRRELNRR